MCERNSTDAAGNMIQGSMNLGFLITALLDSDGGQDKLKVVFDAMEALTALGCEVVGLFADSMKLFASERGRRRY